jgi:hypothetical protein
MHVKLSQEVPNYELLRAWAVSPVSSPPPGWQHLLRGGLATWVRQTSAVPPEAGTHAPGPAAGSRLVAAPLTRLVAAMIAEMIAQVCS